MTTQSGYFIMEYEFKDHSLIVLEGPNCKFWLGEGLPDFEGSIEAFGTMYPEKLETLLKDKIIRKLT